MHPSRLKESGRLRSIDDSWSVESIDRRVAEMDWAMEDDEQQMGELLGNQTDKPINS